MKYILLLFIGLVLANAQFRGGPQGNHSNFPQPRSHDHPHFGHHLAESNEESQFELSFGEHENHRWHPHPHGPPRNFENDEQEMGEFALDAPSLTNIEEIFNHERRRHDNRHGGDRWFPNRRHGHHNFEWENIEEEMEEFFHPRGPQHRGDFDNKHHQRTFDGANERQGGFPHGGPRRGF